MTIWDCMNEECKMRCMIANKSLKEPSCPYPVIERKKFVGKTDKVVKEKVKRNPIWRCR